MPFPEKDPYLDSIARKELKMLFPSPNKDYYLNTIDRLEPEIACIDPGAFYVSAAISLKRIADCLERIELMLLED